MCVDRGARDSEKIWWRLSRSTLRKIEPQRIKIVGVMMNTRALMGLIVINVGYDLVVISQQMLTILVIIAIFSTVILQSVVAVRVRLYVWRCVRICSLLRGSVEALFQTTSLRRAYST